jgi:Protein of unknown function (DUF4054)
MTPTQFRETFRQFADREVYTDIALNYYITTATAFLPASRWGTLLDFGIGLFMAHHLALDARDALTAGAGGIPGDVRGPATQKSVDKVSQGYDTKAVTWENSAFWNQTRYGVQLINLARQFGAGGFQLGTCGASFEPGVFPPFFDSETQF